MDYQKFLGFMAFAGLCLCSCDNGAKKQLIHSVMVVVPEAGDTAGSGGISLPGVVKERQTVKVGFKIAGQIERLLVKEGDYVNKGQLVAVLDDADYQLGLDASVAQYKQLNSEVERLTKLYERKSVSANEYEKAVSSLDQVKADMQAKKNQMAYTKLYTPASGYVERLAAHVGEMVNVGTTVISLIDVGQMQIEIGLPANIYHQRNSFSDFVTSIEGKVYKLQLLNIIPKAVGTQQYTMQLALPNQKGLKETSGRNVEVRFTVGSGSTDEMNNNSVSGIRIPESAIVYDGSKTNVFVLQADSTVKKKAVIIDGVDHGKVVVIQGLDSSEKVIKAGGNYLYDGERVKVLSKPAGSNPGGLI